MALIKCKECGKEISNKASFCVHCGCPIEGVEKTSTNNALFQVNVIEDTLVVGKAKSGLIDLSVTNGIYTGKNSHGILASGITKDRAEIILNFLTRHNGKGEICEDTESQELNQNMMDYIDIHYNRNAPVMCPRCKSKQVVTGQRGYKITSGFFGSSKTVNRCSSCGHSWEPKKIT